MYSLPKHTCTNQHTLTHTCSRKHLTYTHVIYTCTQDRDGQYFDYRDNCD